MAECYLVAINLTSKNCFKQTILFIYSSRKRYLVVNNIYYSHVSLQQHVQIAFISMLLKLKSSLLKSTVRHHAMISSSCNKLLCIYFVFQRCLHHFFLIFLTKSFILFSISCLPRVFCIHTYFFLPILLLRCQWFSFRVT